MLVCKQGTSFLFSEPFNGIHLHLSKIFKESTVLKQFEIKKIYELCSETIWNWENLRTQEITANSSTYCKFQYSV